MIITSFFLIFNSFMTSKNNLKNLQIFKQKLVRLNKKEIKLTNIIKLKLEQMKKLSRDKFSYWFGREWIKINQGEKLAEVKKQIIKLYWKIKILEGKKPKYPKNWISEPEKQQALQFSLIKIAEIYLKDLKKTGKYFRACCPFHPDKNPSFTIFEDNHFYCFGCQEHGSVINFIMKIENCSFPKAVKILLNY